MSTHQAPCCGREPITHSSKNLPKKNRRFGWDVSQLNKTLKNCVFSEKISYKTKVFKSSWWKPESNVMIFPMGFPWNNSWDQEFVHPWKFSQLEPSSHSNRWLVQDDFPVRLAEWFLGCHVRAVNGNPPGSQPWLYNRSCLGENQGTFRT